MDPKFLVGIDEVGRGPVAGPVYVCAFWAKAESLDEIISGSLLPVRDSKKLTKKMREKWFKYLQDRAGEGNFRYVISKASNTEIDDKGIAVCIKACVNNCLTKLKLDTANTKVYLDGGLRADGDYIQETIIKGDENTPIISLASIIAKVSRDTEMEKLAVDFPEYLWEKNMGYGTSMHMDAVKKFGTTPLHRVSFLKNV